MRERQGAKFPRSMRLLRRADFERVYQQGRRHFSAHLTVFYLRRMVAGQAGSVPVGERAGLENGAEHHEGERAKTVEGKDYGLRVGFTVSRALGGAVARNRMKRRLREAVRLSAPPVGISADIVINPKKSLLTADFTALLNEVNAAFVVIVQKLAAGKT